MVSPFRCNLQGTVADMQDAVPAASGQLLRMFKLVDGKGRYVVIKQLGSRAADETIKNEMSVNLYYVDVRKSWRAGEDGSTWAYENALCVPSNVRNHLCKPTQQICIPSGVA